MYSVIRNLKLKHCLNTNVHFYTSCWLCNLFCYQQLVTLMSLIRPNSNKQASKQRPVNLHFFREYVIKIITKLHKSVTVFNIKHLNQLFKSKLQSQSEFWTRKCIGPTLPHLAWFRLLKDFANMTVADSMILLLFVFSPTDLQCFLFAMLFDML